MEGAYARAMDYARKHRDARYLEALIVGLNKHRHWMESRGN